MSRMGASDAIVVKPSNNIYTVLVIVAFLLELLAFVVLWMRHTALFGGGPIG